MSITVADILDLELLSSQHVVCSGADAVSHIPVEGVSVIEIPVEDFIRPHELVLSTAIGCGHSPALFFKFVKDVIQSQASALIIAIGRHITQVPEQVKSYAQSQHFPIIEIPWRVRFSDITQAVINQLHQWHRDVLDQSEQAQKQFLQLFIQGAELSTFCRHIQQTIGYPILILDRGGYIQGSSPRTSTFKRRWDPEWWLGEVERLKLDDTVPSQTPVTLSAMPVYDQQSHILVWTVQVAGDVKGYMLLILGENQGVPFPQTATMLSRIMEHATSVAALYFQRSHAILETELRMRGDFVWRLAQGDISAGELGLSRHQTFQYRLDLPYACFVVHPHMNAHTSKKEYEETVSSIKTWLKCMAQDMYREIMIAYEETLFVIYLEIKNLEVHDQRLCLDTLDRYISHVEEALRKEKRTQGLKLSWGIGVMNRGINAFKESYDEAYLAFQIGHRERQPGHRSTFQNTRHYRLFATLSENAEVQALLTETIEPIMAYDRQRGMHLAHTLMTYIQHKSNVSQTARALHLHRQSLGYRLKRIETLTGLSLEDPDSLMMLYLGLKLYKDYGHVDA
ncbi:PucR family transcriptional regulator [Caldalkalibacillus salinus]|uniref:PucR family transcriptional regulator n=1 Tax=Caldalkalibacillus salinus TaxID=2803787 RepID=UPI00192473BD|nr:PucR family transcriptional regulator [Caldalkalibacillus salinus]